MNKKRILEIGGVILLTAIILNVAWSIVFQQYFEKAKIKNQGPENPMEALSEASVLIWQYNSTPFYAWRNMSTNKVMELSNDASAVINNAFGNLTSDRTWQETVYLKGNFTMDSPGSPSSYTRIVIDGRITLTYSGASVTALNLTGVHNVDIEGGYFDGGRTTALVYNASRVGTCPIELKNAFNCQIKGSSVVNSNNHAIVLKQGCHDDEIADCFINNTYNDGINIQGGDYNIIVRSNDISYCGHVPIVLSTCYQCTVADNVLSHSGQRTPFGEILVFQNAYRNTITGNVCTYVNGSSGVIYINGHENTVSGNICANSAKAYGIQCYSSGSFLCHDNTITGNICEEDLKGICLSTDGTAYCYDNLVSDNTCILDQDGIILGTATVVDNTISGNKVNNNTRYGIYFVGGLRTQVTNNVICNNTSSGICLQPSNFAMVFGNSIYNNGAYGLIVVSSASGNNTINSNYFMSNTSGAISDAGTSTVAFDNFDPTTGTWITSINPPTSGR